MLFVVVIALRGLCRMLFVVGVLVIRCWWFLLRVLFCAFVLLFVGVVVVAC